MAGFVSRLVACLVAVVAVLQLVHLVLLNKLESTRLQELRHLQKQQQLHQFQRDDLGPEKSDNTLNPYHHLNRRRDDNPLNWGNWRQERSASAQFPEQSEHDTIRFDNLLREDQGAIVDSTGEFRIVFDVAGPQSSSISIPQAVIDKDDLISGGTNNNGNGQADDFSIDDENVDSIPPPMDVTLVTYGDYHDTLQFLIPLVSQWNGPISVAIFASNSGDMQAILEFISQARSCHAQARQFISFHLVFPLVETHANNKHSSNSNNNNNASRIEKFRKSLKRLNSTSAAAVGKSCQSLRDQINKYYKSGGVVSESIRKYGGIPDKYSLPTNLLRNIARRRVATEYSFVSNMNMVPSVNLRSMFQQFARDKLTGHNMGADAKKTVYVIPAFEIKFEEQIPLHKHELLALVDKHKARPFQFDMCWKCQMYTDYEAWQKDRNPRASKFGVLFEVLWRDPWQPFFISDNSVPLFDERFRYNGVSRMSQLCELHVAGYKFAVLNDAFLIHRGYTAQPQKSSDDKSSNVDASRAQFRQFKTELKDKYPHSTRRCY